MSALITSTERTVLRATSSRAALALAQATETGDTDAQTQQEDPR